MFPDISYAVGTPAFQEKQENVSFFMPVQHPAVHCSSADVFFQNPFQCCHGAAVRAGNPCAAVQISENTVDHFMRYSVGEQNQKIGTSDVSHTVSMLLPYILIS